jgi:very-short-patch-repair endonuclease
MSDKFYEKKLILPKFETDSFLKLPRRCQEMIFEQITRIGGSGYLPFSICGLPEYIISPIEQMFHIAFSVVNYEYYDSEFNIESQVKILIRDKKYYADFLISYGLNDENKFIVECDGHEFHKTTKEQVKNDNERDMELKKIGYDVIHFSGSQLYENAWKCADDVCDYIKRKCKERC